MLRRVRWSESSLIITLYSLDFGRISVIAKGALRPKNSLFGQAELFSCAEYTISRKERRNIDTTIDISVLDYNNSIRIDPLAYAFSCLYIEWMLNVITGSEPSQSTYHLLKNVLSLFGEGSSFWPVLCSGIEKLLRLSGHAIEVSICTKCGRESGNSCHWNPLSGGIVCSDCASGEIKVPAGFLLFIKNSRQSSLREIQNINLWKGGFRQTFDLLREFTEIHYDMRMKLKSLSIVEDLDNA
ncbi:MAG: DNA repair protein RecO [FCB group bacterium]|nr:DNA repair protein RecO [FCB group bacterium]